VTPLMPGKPGCVTPTASGDEALASAGRIPRRGSSLAVGSAAPVASSVSLWVPEE